MENTNNNNYLNSLINTQNVSNNINNNFFNVNSNSSNGNVDLMDMKSGDKLVDEKLKKITDNIDELYKNPNENFNTNGKGNNGLNVQNKSNKQNDLFNALNPQFNNPVNNNMHLQFKNMQQQQPQLNIQNNYYNYGNNQPGQFNLNHNNNNNQFYSSKVNMGFNNVHGIGSSGFNGGYGANYPPNVNMNMNQQMNFSNYNNNNSFKNNNNNGRIMNNINNFNSGFLTANDIYARKDESTFNLNYNGHSNGNNNLQGNANILEFSETKPKKNEDPFSNLISFK